jgi:hypothetical protein
MKRFVREKLRAEPKDTVGFRTIVRGDSRVVLALRRSGGAVAVSVLKPRKSRGGSPRRS